MKISVVIPAHNEQENIRPVYDGIRRHLSGLEAEVEILFVDDGSTDETAQRVRDIRLHDPLVRLIRFTRNFGQQAALWAGLKAAGGDAVITMDCDLQHPPALLPQMVEAWRAGASVVQMVRSGTAGAGWFKRLSSDLFYKLMQWLCDFPVTKGAGDYQLLDRQVVDAILQFSDRRPFVRGIVGWFGFPARRIEFVAPPRAAGRPSYGLLRMVRLAVEAVTGLSGKPLRLAFYLGFSTAALCLAYGLFALIAFFQGRSVPGWTSIVMVVMFLGSVQLISAGIIGEYIARIYDHTRRLPPYVIVEEERGAEASRRQTDAASHSSDSIE